MITFVYKDKEGNECRWFSLWVAENCTEEEKAIHDDPTGTPAKAELLLRYMKAVKAYSIHIYQDGELIDEDLLENQIPDYEV